MNFRVENSRVFAEGGLPCPARGFADGRTCFQADNEGLCDIGYFGRSHGSYIVMRKRSPAAHNPQFGAAFITFGVNDFNEPDLTGGAAVRRTTRAQIRARNFDQAHIFG